MFDLMEHDVRDGARPPEPDLRRVPSEQLARAIVELERQARALVARRLLRVAELDRRARVRGGLHATATWLAGALGMSFTAAREDVRVGRALEAMPATSAALASGRVSASAVRVLAGARADHPDGFSASEADLVRAAETSPPQELARVIRRWSEDVDPAGAADAGERLRERRRLRVCPDPSGMVRIDGELDPETGETVMTALRAIRDAEARHGGLDARTKEQRAADALGELSRQWLDGAERPRVAGERPHLTLTVGLDALRGPRARASELAHGSMASPELLRRLACDAAVIPVVMGGASEPLDVGRKTAVVPPGMRRAVVLRDVHCRFPGCDRPQAWCDAHHVAHWADGGTTALSNLVLLCRAHHRAVHQGFGIEMTPGGPVFRRADGTLVQDRAQPP